MGTECVRISLDCTVNMILPVCLYLCAVTLRAEFASGKYYVFVAILFLFVLFVFCLVCVISFNKTTNVHETLALTVRIWNNCYMMMNYFNAFYFPKSSREVFNYACILTS